MTTATQNPTVERYRKMVEIIDNCSLDEAYNILTTHSYGNLKTYYELVISKSADYSCWYARNVIKGPWEPGEEAISKDKGTLANYALQVIMGRLPEHLEKILLSDEEEADAA